MATKQHVRSGAARWLALSSVLFGGACAGEKPEPAAGVGLAGAPSAGVSGGGSAPAGGSAATTLGGAAPSAGAPPAVAGTASAGASNGGTANGSSTNGGTASSGTNAGGGGGASNGAGSAGAAGSASGAGGGPAIPAGCVVSNPVSFKADIGPWLNSSCGKGKGSGCHVTDDSSTAGSACPDGSNKCGFNHAYDWITAGSHNQFCKQTPGPIRYTVVLDVIRGANPASCTSTRIMPPDGPAVTECQKAALAAWLAEPMVSQLHRSDDTSPITPYLMPPFN
ncbi:MAG: hypothetical protein ABUL60_31955 [Myxococcales bacterium]